LLTRRRIIAAIGTLVLVAAIAFVVEAVLAGLAMNAARTDGDAVAARLTVGDLAGARPVPGLDQHSADVRVRGGGGSGWRRAAPPP